jgi:dihydroflavonol-4-reductase
MTTVVVTGATGHIGNNLVRALLQRSGEGEGIRLRALVHNDDTRSLKGLDGIEFVRGDVRDLSSLQSAFSGADVVYHLAALISISDDEDRLVEEVNVGGTRNVVTACQRAGVRRLVHFSSVHALWGLPKDRPIDENQELADRPDALAYDRSKAMGEKAVLAGVQSGLDAVIVNPGSVVGPNDFRPSAQGQFFIDLCKRKLPGLVEGGYNWCDVRDVVRGAMAAEKRGRRGERYLLAGHSMTIKEVADTVGQVSGVRVPRMVTPLWLAQLFAPAAEAFSKLLGKRPLVTSHSLQIVGGNYAFTIDKARRELGYSPRPFIDTVRDSIDWYRQNGYL